MPVLEPPRAGIPEPVPSRWSRPYWEGLAQGELRYQRCAGCGTAVFAPAPVCPGCLSGDLVWEVSAGRGTIYSWTVVWRPQTPAFRVPYAAAIVDLDEGWRMLANVIGCEPDDLAVDLPVVAEIVRVSDTLWLPCFRPVAA